MWECFGNCVGFVMCGCVFVWVLYCVCVLTIVWVFFNMCTCIYYGFILFR